MPEMPISAFGALATTTPSASRTTMSRMRTEVRPCSSRSICVPPIRDRVVAAEILLDRGLQPRRRQVDADRTAREPPPQGRTQPTQTTRGRSAGRRSASAAPICAATALRVSGESGAPHAACAVRNVAPAPLRCARRLLHGSMSFRVMPYRKAPASASTGANIAARPLRYDYRPRRPAAFA